MTARKPYQTRSINGGNGQLGGERKMKAWRRRKARRLYGSLYNHQGGRGRGYSRSILNAIKTEEKINNGRAEEGRGAWGKRHQSISLGEAYTDNGKPALIKW